MTTEAVIPNYFNVHSFHPNANGFRIFFKLLKFK